MSDTIWHLTAEELRLFSERIEKRLAEHPVLLEKADHLAAVAGLIQRVGGGSFYEILDVDAAATWQEVHDAYERLAPQVHPSQAYKLGMLGREGVFDMLFERITEAYLTLSQPDRRKVYDRDLAPKVSPSPTPAARAVEAKAVARRHFDRAVWLAEAEDFFFAVELLRQAVRLDPKPDYYAMLGRLEAKNPKWLHLAVDHLQYAIDLGSTDGGLPAALEEIRARLLGGESAATAEVAGPARTRSKSPEVEVIDPEDAEGGALGTKRPSRIVPRQRP